ncbi:hypothetical protein QYE76_019944 [Lolium multiflorum]|uniref:DUF6598 domain-containing protein n=1 Tax=Lolium multiflorum TaxID=4521 RepID=A0AAD8R625_LOLMU|nr:hypothetical protein QYE76_019944 [Lolium multiflorum]
MEVDGQSYKSWAWWLHALQAMRCTYSVPMDVKEARIRADVAEARRKEMAAAAALRLKVLREGKLMKWIFQTQDPEALRAAAEEARRMDWPDEERVAVDRWAKTKDPEAAYQKQLREEREEMHERMMKVEIYVDTHDWSEPCNYRKKWYSDHAGHGKYEDTSNAAGIQAMRFTDIERNNRDRIVYPTGTLQIFSFKVTRIGEELRWPLDVYGLIAIRDHLDRKRNIMFARSRDNCQTITFEEPYLTLEGPTRAVFSDDSDSVRFEVVLKVKSATNASEDKDLSFLTTRHRTIGMNRPCVINLAATSKLSKLEWTVGYLAKSVEATINIQVIYGKWPDGCRGIFSASNIGLDDMKVLLLSLEDDKLPVNNDGIINLSRNVACAEIDGELKISVATEYADGEQVSTAKHETTFTPREDGRSCDILKIRTCKMKVVVAWSLVCSY